ncbi:MAG: AAA family ATPase [Thermoplasmata archaeon]|uniref:Cytidylate kinase n=1 Tax=Candidatus Aciduliprofundum boonei TaxID=379547 RepID=A0A7J3TAC8_9ARCH|nr:AAA family ATPase [Thermoplasmata archaeon]HHE75518.1 AAA family ATPase [Candidatus Aciduliprofundum boonei]
MRITISGPPGSGKTTVAKLLADKLKYPLICGGDIFRSMAKKKGMDIIEFSKYAEKNWEIDREVDKRIIEMAEDLKDVVIDSRLSGWLMHLNNIPSYKVYINASLEIRAKRIWKREGGELPKIMERVKIREESEKRRYREIYGINFEDLSIYDLVVDSNDLTPEEVVECIIEGIGYGEKH